MPDKAQASDTTGGVEAVERALRVLDCFEPGDTGLSLKEVADRSGVNKATILRLSVSLEKFGHITRDAEGLFHLGPSLWRLGVRISPEPAHGAYCTPCAGEPGECNRGKRVVLRAARQFRRLPLPCQFAQACAGSCRRGRDHSAEHGLVGPGTGCLFFREGKQATNIRKAGYYLSLGERDPDVAGLSVPVLGLEGELLGCC